MKIDQKRDGAQLTLTLTGRLDTSTAPELEQTAHASLPGVAELTIDMNALEYISSAGLRVLLSMQKVMDKQGAMRITGANEIVREVFDITGFSEILTVE